MPVEEQQDEVHESGVAPPPLFSPHIYVPEKFERRTFKEGYTTDFARYMSADYDEQLPVLLLAKKYNLPVTWKRVLEVVVHEAWALKAQVGFSVHDVRCKVTVGDQTGRTPLVDPNAEQKVIWNQTFKFIVGDPCDINLLLYCQNIIIPNDKLGRITITPNDLVERRTTTEWFPLNTTGEVKLNTTLSTPRIAPFKFSFPSQLSISSRTSNVFNANDEKVFSLIGKWPFSVSLLDRRANSVLTFKNCVNELREKEFTAYLYGENKPALTLSQVAGKGDSEFRIEGIPSLAAVKTNLRNFTYFSADGVQIASAKLVDEKYIVEIRAGQDVVLLIATMVLIAKLLLVEGQEIKEWNTKRSSGSFANIRHSGEFKNLGPAQIRDSGELQHPGVAKIRDSGELQHPGLAKIRESGELQHPGVAKTRDVADLQHPGLANVRRSENLRRHSVEFLKSSGELSFLRHSGSGDIRRSASFSSP